MLVLTLNHGTGLSEWQPLLAVSVFDVADEPMAKIDGRRHTSVTTLAHRWPVVSGTWTKRTNGWRTSADLMAKAAVTPASQDIYERLVLAAPSADLPTEPKYSDALVETVAWYYTEGDLGERPGRHTPRVAISQSHLINPENVARIGQALTVLFGPESDAFDKGGRYASGESIDRRAAAKALRADSPKMSANEIGRRLGVSGVMAGKYLRDDARIRDGRPRWRKVLASGGRMTRFKLNAAAEVVLEHAPSRIVSLDFIRSLTSSQLELFLDVSVRGDGYLMGGTTMVFSQKDPRMVEAFELAAILSGRSPRRSQHVGIGASADGPRTKVQESVIVSGKTFFSAKSRHLSQETHTGILWCPTTANGTWLAQHHGDAFYTGNSSR
ncbi:hypothetical protein GCM10010468_82160 [Actinocorallia longicatena]|uniref:Uncharacterized protein n=1 Tax=Actinocorallia longicatena TaxID=111803 RepID=A0ABP6QPI4_9ACTN